jgi:hypothetical protein
MVVLVLSVVVLAGCEKTFNITITNATPQASALEMKDPSGFHPLGLLEPGRSRHYTLKLAQDELPADCELNAGGMKKAFPLDKNDKDEQYFYLDASGIVGPTHSKREYVESKRFESRSSKMGGPVITGDRVPPPPGGSGGDVPIEQHEVVE